MTRIEDVLNNKQIQQMSLAALRYQSIAKATQSALSVIQGDKYSRVLDTYKLSNKVLIGTSVSAHLAATYEQASLGPKIESALGKTGTSLGKILDQAATQFPMEIFGKSTYLMDSQATTSLKELIIAHNHTKTILKDYFSTAKNLEDEDRFRLFFQPTIAMEEASYEALMQAAYEPEAPISGETDIKLRDKVVSGVDFLIVVILATLWWIDGKNLGLGNPYDAILDKLTSDAGFLLAMYEFIKNRFSHNSNQDE